MKKVQDLEGAELDYWVAKAEGFDKTTEQQQRDHLYLKIIGDSCHLPSGGAYRPSSDWSQAGPIIDRGQVAGISPAKKGKPGWEATASSLSAKSTFANCVAVTGWLYATVRVPLGSAVRVAFATWGGCAGIRADPLWMTPTTVLRVLNAVPRFQSRHSLNSNRRTCT